MYKYHSCPSPQTSTTAAKLLEPVPAIRQMPEDNCQSSHPSKIHLKNTSWTTENPSPPAACAFHTPNPALVVWK